MNEEDLLLNPNLEELSDERKRQLQAQVDRYGLTDEEPVEADTTTTVTPMASGPTSTKLTPVETSPFKKEDGSLDWDKLDKYGREGDIDVLAGLFDFAAPILNIIPGVTAKPLNDFENEYAQTVRAVSSVLLPTMALGGGGSAFLSSKAAKAPVASKFLNDPAVKYFGNALFQAGAGAFVDYTVPMNQEDDNLAGFLKKQYPRSLGWVSDSIATTDQDSPDQKRAKNVVEGAYLGFVTDMLQGAYKLSRGQFSFKNATGWVPENEKAKNYFKDNVVIDETPEAAVDRSAGKRAAALDEVGQYNFERSLDLDSPSFGYHDVYGAQELGIRSVDDLGIVGASVDVVRINTNSGTSYGRVGSVASDAAIKFANESGKNGDIVLKGLASELQDSGKYGYRVDDSRYISHLEIVEQGEALANDIYQMDLNQMKATFVPEKEYRGIRLMGRDADTQVAELTSPANAGVLLAIRKYMDDFINMDEARARAYTMTSVAGQISDMAQGMRLTEGSGSLQRAQEQILDRVQFLLAQKGQTSYVRGRSLNLLNLWNRMTRPGSKAFDDATRTRIANQIASEKNKTLAAIDAIFNEAKEVVDGLREIKESRPEMLTPLIMAYELTDGNVKTISALNNYMRQSSSIWRKAFYDGQPEIPSVVLRGFYANLYNSALSAFSTPIKAVISGGHLLVEKPIRQFAGAIRPGADKQQLRRAFYQYSNGVEAMRNSLKYMKSIFKKSALDPNVIASRENLVDIQLQNNKQIETMEAFADAQAAGGHFGPQVFVEQLKAINDLANHPALRFGTRAMQAMDGFTQSMIADFEAKGIAFDKFTKNGTVEFDAKAAENLYKDAHSKMFDKNGIITDKAVQRAAGEISLNLDTPLNDGVSALITRMPILKPFMLFTKTPINELQLSSTYIPLGKFIKGLNQFRMPFDEMDTGTVKQLLTERGIEIDPLTMRNKYEEIRADLFGRKAIGTLFTGLAVSLVLSDRLHGNGHYNRQVQKTRNESNWKPRSIKGIADDKWYSIDGLGHITNLMALIADIGDNFDVLAPNDVGELLKRTAFVVGASLTDKTMLAGLEPLIDISSGDVGAINRWGSSFLSAASIRGSSQMAEIARLMDPGLKQINNDLTAMIMNRMPFSKSILPKKYDWIDGGEVNVPDNMIARFRNTYTPWKESGKISPEKQFLIDIEYDAAPVLRTNGRGTALTNTEQSDILSNMGNPELHEGTPPWKRRIQEVMNSIGGKEFRRRFKADGAVDVDEYLYVHRLLDDALRSSIQDSIINSKHLTTIERREEVRLRSAEYRKKGDVKGLEEYLKNVRKNYGM